MHPTTSATANSWPMRIPTSSGLHSSHFVLPERDLSKPTLQRAHKKPSVAGSHPELFAYLDSLQSKGNGQRMKGFFGSGLNKSLRTRHHPAFGPTVAVLQFRAGKHVSQSAP
jgi:hypothetical protein